MSPRLLTILWYNPFDARLIRLQGTPVQNHLAELWSLLHFLDAAKFPSQEDFMLSFSDLSQPSARAQLHGLLRPHMLRRTKEDVMKTLPAKHEVIVPVGMAPVQVRSNKDFVRFLV